MITTTYQPDNGGAYKITSTKEGDYIIAILWFYNGGGVALRHKCNSSFNGDFIEATAEEVRNKMSVSSIDAAHIADYINDYMLTGQPKKPAKKASKKKGA